VVSYELLSNIDITAALSF